jgi:dTDP-4-amino-4,6-dideoxygalactose transaminase
MKGLGVKPGDEVITSAHSWISTSETITQAGGKVVFCDTDDKTFTVDPERVAEKITPRAVGIIPVHLFGQPAAMDAIMNLARKHNLWVLEDSAQAQLARCNGRMVGTFGIAATFSFYPGKNLGAMGDAGCIGTNDNKLAEWCALYARHGGKGDHRMEGINSRMDGLQAAILSVKLKHLPSWTKKRQEIAKAYDKALADIEQVRTPEIGDGREHVYHLYVIRAENRDALRKHLGEHGIATVLNYPKALPFYPAYEYLGHKPEDFPNAYQNQSRILSLPIFPELLKEQQHSVCDAIRKFYGS